jgi:predicted MFS family arabinose efflux permease
MQGRIGQMDSGKRASFSKVPKRVKWTIYFTVFDAIGIGYLFTIIPAYLPEQGFSSEQVGFLLAAFSLATLVCAIPLGLMSDRMGRKNVLYVGLLLFPPLFLAFALTQDLNLLIIFCMVGGVAEAAYLTAWNALIADQTTLENRNSAFALSFLFGGAFTGLGFALPLFFPYIEAITGWSSAFLHQATFVTLALLCIIPPVAMYFVFRDYHEKRPEEGEKRKTGRLAKSRDNLIKFSLTNLLIGLGAGFIISLIPTWLFLKFGVTDSFSGPLLAISSITMAFASFASARLAFRYGSIKAIVLTQGISTIFLVMIPFMIGPIWAGAVYIVRSMFMNMSAPIQDSFLMSIIDKDERGLASAINNIIWRLPNSVTTIFGGMLLSAGFYDLPFFITAACYVAGIGIFFVLFRKVQPLE